ncbi:MAG: TIGR04283 family arsenosugar biosynthesis glycosyltransferase [Usitatibacter sp.]
MPRFSIIVPVLEEASGIEAALAALQPYRHRGEAEVIVADGASTDGTRSMAAPFADRVIEARRGRALQMNAGARASDGDILLFLHADTRLPAGALDFIAEAIDGGREWGRFDVTIDGGGALLALVAWFMNARSRFTGIATGDQAIFVRRAVFETVGGYQSIPLMEDVALSKALARSSRPACLRARAVTSSRRWERHGTLRTIVLMWRLRLAYALGEDPHRLARRYEVERTSH